jgi:hypothetical protein
MILTAPAQGPVCVVSHDAGGAEILASYLEQSKLEYLPVVEGPALAVFRRRLGPLDSLPLERALVACRWCLLGTSWQSDLEWHALDAARRAGRPTVSFLDHWVNYAERFVRYGVQRLPDEIWVGDERALLIARQRIPAARVRMVPNPYFIHVRETLAALSARVPSRSGGGTQVLFVCENISGHASERYGDPRHWGYTEFDAINYFFHRHRGLGSEIERVVLRPHPSDTEGKYDSVVTAYAPLACLSDGATLLEEIAAASIVAGCESVALVAALMAGKRVLSCIPPGGHVQFIDQQPGIEMLRDLPARVTSTPAH